MWTILAVFAASFVFVAVLTVAIAWAMQAKAELAAWKTRHQRLVDAENERAWHANRRMAMY